MQNDVSKAQSAEDAQGCPKLPNTMLPEAAFAAIGAIKLEIIGKAMIVANPTRRSVSLRVIARKGEIKFVSSANKLSVLN